MSSRAIDDAFDPPAAHSMDTTWFAVDADGCVGVFESGEAGGVPNDAPIGMSPGDSTFEVALFDGLVAARRFEAGTLRPPSEDPNPGDARLIAILEPTTDGPTTYRDQAGRLYGAQALLAPFDPVVVHDHDPRVLVTRRVVPPAKAKAIASAKGVLRVLASEEMWDALDGPEPPVFAYGNDDYEAPGRYVRQSAPEAPIRVDDLPEPIRDHLASFRIPVRFQENTELQLADYFDAADVATWDELPLQGAPEGWQPPAPPPPSPPPRTDLPFTIIVSSLAVVFLIGLLLYILR